MEVFRQPDSTTCGSAVLVRARMLADPAYDRWLRSGADPEARFADEALRTHRRTNRLLDSRRRPQLPWPRSLGTQPWAVARELPGRHRVRPVLDREPAWERLVGATDPTPLYVGSTLLPRHVVLVTGPLGEDRLQVYEPSAGATVTVHREAFVAARLGLASWNHPWWVVTTAFGGSTA